MTRPDHGRNNSSEAAGMGAHRAHSADGRVVRYGMAGGGAHAGSNTSYLPDGYGQHMPDDPFSQMPTADPYMHPQGQQAFAQQAYAQPQAVYPHPVYATADQYVPPETSVPRKAPKKKRKRAFWIALVIAIICIALAILLALAMCDGKTKRQGSLGQLEGKSESEIQAELDRVVDEGMFNISIASSVVFDRGDAPGELRIENVPGNRYLMKVDIVRDDTGEVIYTTDLIEPNHHIQTDTLDVSLPKGTYDCTAIFEACDMETEEAIGQAAAQIVIQVAS